MEATTIVIPATPGSLLSGKHMSVIPIPASQLPALAHKPAPRFSQRQIWLTAGIGMLALLISIASLMFFLGNASSHRSPLQVHSGGVTATPPATSVPGTLLTPTMAGAVLTGSPTATATHAPTATPTSTPSPTPTTVKPTPTPTTPPPTPTPTPKPAVLSCTVDYQTTSQWGGGILVNITITNTGTTTIQGWTLIFSFTNGEQIYSGWNGRFSQNGAQVSITNVDFNATLAPGASTTPGFQAAAYRGESSTPTAFSLNGVACQ